MNAAAEEGASQGRSDGFIAAPRNRRPWLPRPVRAVFTLLSFAIFFVGTLLLSVVFMLALLPLVIFARARYRRIVTWMVGRGMGTFIFWMRMVRLFTMEPMVMPDELRGRPYMLVANHPTLIDVLFLLNACEGLTSVVKESWYRFPLFAPMLRSLNYLPTQRAAQRLDGGTPGLDAMVHHLEAGHALVAFPEGTRSKANKLNRFRRGTFEAAMRAGVPLLVVFIGVDQPLLMKGQSVFDVPEVTPHFQFEVREIIWPEDYADLTSEQVRVRVRDDLTRRFCEHRGLALPARTSGEA